MGGPDRSQGLVRKADLTDARLLGAEEGLQGQASLGLRASSALWEGPQWTAYTRALPTGGTQGI
jgi:hypothetical protein